MPLITFSELHARWPTSIAMPDSLKPNECQKRELTNVHSKQKIQLEMTMGRQAVDGILPVRSICMKILD